MVDDFIHNPVVALPLFSPAAAAAAALHKLGQPVFDDGGEEEGVPETDAPAGECK